jgi:hypothetical protein
MMSFINAMRERRYGACQVPVRVTDEVTPSDLRPGHDSLGRCLPPYVGDQW